MRSPLRALVVDDNDIVRRLIELMLEEAGFVSAGAESAEAALEAVRATPPDVCVVDEVMPGMHGGELIRRLRGAGDPRIASLAIIGISGREGAARILLEAGADGFVGKPVEEHALLPAVARALIRRRRSAPAADPPAP